MYCALAHLTAISQVKNKKQVMNLYSFTTESLFMWHEATYRVLALNSRTVEKKTPQNRYLNYHHFVGNNVAAQ